MAEDANPLDPETPVGQVRLLISDTQLRRDPGNPSAPAEYYFSDAFIGGYLSMNAGNVFHAAADAITALAANEAMVSKKIRKENLQTDGPAVANAMRLLAQDLRARGNRVQEATDAADGTFFIVDFSDPVTPFDQFEAANGGSLWG
jgi:hypothetical protein